MTSLQDIPGVGPKTIKKLGEAGLKTESDLVNYFPFRYEDYSNLKKAEEICDKEDISIAGVLTSKGQFRSRSGKLVTSLRFKQDKKAFGAIWFNQTYIHKSVEVGKTYMLAGKAKVDGKQISLFAPKIKEFEGESLGIVPIYHQSADLKSNLVWKLNKQILQDFKIDEFLPVELLRQYGLIGLEEAYKKIHIPKTVEDYRQAQIRFATDELMGIYLKAELNQAVWREKRGFSIDINLDSISALFDAIPFKLTKSQHESVLSVWKEMKNSYPMNKLLVGDVGSGKTIVAALACGLVAMAGYKSIVLCPTQVLAEQHFNTISEFLKKFKIKVGIMTSKSKTEGQVIIGTHALFTKSNLEAADELALVVIDEEQRFGVLQRGQFLSGDKWPHILSLTATPIPRTIAMMNLGNVSYSYLSEKPADRKVVKTYLIDDKKREKMLTFCEEHILEKDERVFYVCPLIDAGIKGRNATQVADELSEHWGKKIKVGLLHGRTEAKEKNRIMSAFRNGDIQLLVATTVIEVGVDIPRATIMIIDSAHQFGLSQLHQLRGRVGRDGSQGFCFLISDDEESKDRLGVLVKESDGLAIARKDLSLRGPGDVFGLDQSGRWDTSFEAFWDGKVNENAKEMASMIALDEPRSMEILNKINPSLANFDLPN